jgi:hypothetical protein
MPNYIGSDDLIVMYGFGALYNVLLLELTLTETARIDQSEQIDGPAAGDL